MDRHNWVKRACAVFLLCAVTAIALPAQTFTTLHSFGQTDGDAPDAALVQAADGNLHGTAVSGGAHDSGTIFKITPSGTLTTVYSFSSQSMDGYAPTAGLIQVNGNLYGTADAGGTNNGGTIFKITPGGMLTALYSFCSQSGCPDGNGPMGLVLGIDGNLDGTTYDGGANSAFGGTVFKITPSGTLTTVYSFCSQSGCTDGQQPSGLVQATDANFYGTTQGGGATNAGTVFRITPSGTLTTLYSFCSSGCTDGEIPSAALVQVTDGNFYGTTLLGGANGGGTVFKITPSGMLTTLYSFCSQGSCTDGMNPRAALVQATDGNLYGTTQLGGANGGSCIYSGGCGTVFKITPSGTLTTLYSFCSQSGCTDGAEPEAALVQDTNGNFYGTTAGGGANDDGSVFSLSVSLGPFVKIQPALGKAGMAVKILGTNLTGATSVSFNGTAATFTVVTSSLITTAVPAGATTGIVQVVTPSRTLSSNVPFRVVP